jgi:hypothetical protein
VPVGVALWVFSRRGADRHAITASTDIGRRSAGSAHGSTGGAPTPALSGRTGSTAPSYAPDVETPPARRRQAGATRTAGLARAQQLAALATGDTSRRHLAEHALVHALSSTAQRAATKDTSLCHGCAGLAHIAITKGADATPAAAAQLRAVIPGLLDVVQPDDAGLDRLIRESTPV